MIIPEGLYSNIEYRYTRDLLLNNATIQRLCSFSKRVFEASVDTTIIQVAKRELSHNDTITIDEDTSISGKRLNQFDLRQIPYYLIPVKLNGVNKTLIDKLLLSETYDRVGDFLEIQQGIIYSGQAKEDVFANDIKNETYKPILDGRDVVKWRINWDIKEYDKFLSYTDKLHRPREERLFLAPQKILLPRRATRIVATIDMQQFYALNTAYICLPLNDKYKIEFLLGILNSKLIDYFYSNLFMGWQITIPALNVIPIPKIPIEQQQKVSLLVTQLLCAKKNDLSFDASILEQEIDKELYKLYGLLEDELELVEGSPVIIR